MNEITCRGCGKPESECICNLLTTDKVKLQERIKELEELMPTKEESMWLLDRIGIAKYFIVNHSVIAKLQKIIGDK